MRVPDVARDVAERFDAGAALDILLISLAIYWLLLLLRGTTAWTVLRGVAVLLIGAVLLARTFDLEVVNWMLERTVTGLVIGAIIVFQPEIRRALERLGRTGWRFALRREDQERRIALIAGAAARLARQRHGALIVFERETGLQEVIDTGVELDAELSAELIGSVFQPNTPLHDGAAIVRGDRIVAAGCTLPLTETMLPDGLGMRHRAALGITEGSDAVVVVVSEERGAIGLAAQGRMRTSLGEERLRQLLRLSFGLRGGRAGRGAAPAAAGAAAERRGAS